MVARMVRDHEVVGSNPVASTNKTAGQPAVLSCKKSVCDGSQGREAFCGSKTVYSDKQEICKAIKLNLTVQFSVNRGASLKA